MKAILIAAGMGTRLRPMTRDLPKCMAIRSGGTTLFDRQIEALRSCGISEIVVIRGYQGEKFTRKDVRYVWNHDFERNNILGSLMKAAAEFDDELLASYSDIWFEPSVPRNLLQAPEDIVLAVDTAWQKAYQGRTDHPPAEAEMVEMDDTPQVRRIGKISGQSGPLHGEFIGMMKFSRAGAEMFRKKYLEAESIFSGKPFQRAPIFEKAYVTDMLQYLTNQGVTVTCQPTAGRWREIDTLQDFENLTKLWGGTA